MGAETAIEWCDRTWSPWEGCQKVSPACDHCYAEARNNRFGGGNWGPGAPRRPTADSGWKKPLAWQREAVALDRPLTVFPSLCDPFDNHAPEGARARFAALMLATPNLIWLLLTKRIGNAAAMLTEMFPNGTPPNVWLGATIATQAEADRDVIKLRQTRYDHNLPVAFLSIEPMLEMIDVRDHLWPVHGWCAAGYGSYEAAKAAEAPHGRKAQALLGADVARSLVNWVIVGGESGAGARPIHPDWVRSLRDQCFESKTAFLFKQWGEYGPCNGEGGVAGGWLDPNGHYYGGLTEWPSAADERRAYMIRWGKARAGRLLDGVQHDGFPTAPGRAA